MNLDGPKIAPIAIGAATLAVLLSLIAVIVVVRRSPKGSDLEVVPFQTAVAAADVVKLRTAVEVAKEDGAVIGVRVTDEKLRASLGLRVADVLTAIAGKPVKNANLDDLIASASLLDPAMLYVDVLREGEPVVLRWELDGNLRAARRSDPLGALQAPSPAMPSVAMGGLRNPFDDPFDADAVKKIDDFHYQVPKSLVDTLSSNPMAFMRGARVVPAMSMGKTEGFKLYAIRPSSLFAKLGFSNGDMIREINGRALSSADKALEIYVELRDANNLEIALTRRGRDETIHIEVR